MVGTHAHAFCSMAGTYCNTYGKRNKIVLKETQLTYLQTVTIYRPEAGGSVHLCLNYMHCYFPYHSTIFGSMYLNDQSLKGVVVVALCLILTEVHNNCSFYRSGVHFHSIHIFPENCNLIRNQFNTILPLQSDSVRGMLL